MITINNTSHQDGYSDQEALAIIQRGDAQETIALAEIPNISPLIVGELFRLYPDLIMRNPAFAVAVSNQDFLFELFRANKSVIPSMKSLDFGWFDWLLKHPDSEVRQLAATNPELPGNLHPFCSQSADRHIRMGIAANRGIAPDVIERLCLDSDMAVRREANANPVGPGKSDVQLQVTIPTKSLHAMSSGASTVPQNPVDFVTEPSGILINSQDQDWSGLLHADPKLHPIIFVCVILGAFCAVLVMMNFGKSSKVSIPTVVNSPVSTASTPTVISEGTYGIYMADALSVATNNTAKSKNAETKREWAAVVDRWNEAIELLEKIPTSSALHKAAQERIDVYKGLKAIAKKRAKVDK